MGAQLAGTLNDFSWRGQIATSAVSCAAGCWPRGPWSGIFPSFLGISAFLKVVCLCFLAEHVFIYFLLSWQVVSFVRCPNRPHMF